MELNGIANILAIIELAKWDKKIDDKVYEEITDQCDLLERYLLALQRSMLGDGDVPKWHKVKASPSRYPTNNGR